MWSETAGYSFVTGTETEGSLASEEEIAVVAADSYVVDDTIEYAEADTDVDDGDESVPDADGYDAIDYVDVTTATDARWCL